MMHVLLLHSSRSVHPSRPLPPTMEDVTRDLALNTVFQTMAQGDAFLLDAARQVVLSSSDDIDTIAYRQEILSDCLKHPSIIKQLYQIPLDYLERKRKQWLWISPRHAGPSSILSGARRLLAASLDLLRTLRRIADQSIEEFQSPGFRRFFAMIQRELDDDYLAIVEQHIRMLGFPQGMLLSMKLGKGNEGTQYVLCKANNADQRWLERLFASRSPAYSYSLDPRDDAGARVLGELRDRGTARVANAVAQAAEHVESFFNVLRSELAFYIGCLNLHEQLMALEAPVVFPRPVHPDERQFSCVGLFDISLALTMGKPVIGNDISADGGSLTIITGPNQGGKTTFLRSVGLAQLMMQSGMFVAAKAFSANLCTGLFTHFRREEDKSMESGKFEEELIRMRMIVDHLTPNALLLCNESFAATNEREGSEVARQIVTALLEKGIKVIYVTHHYAFARHFYEREGDSAMFLRAERLSDGRRTFRLKEARPLETSFGIDLYHRIFGAENQSSMAG